MIPIILNSYEWTKDIEFLFIIFVGLVGYLFSMILFDKFINISGNTVTYKFILNQKILKILTIIVLVYLVSQITFVGIRSFGDLINFLARDRVGDYLNNPIIQKSLLLKPLINSISYVLISYYWKNKKYKIGILLWFFILLNKVMFSHTRFVIIIDLMLPVFFYNYYIKKIKFNFLAMIFISILLFISIGNFARGGTLDAETIKTATSVETILNQIVRASSGSTESFYKLYSSNFEYDMLKQYYYYLPISFVPRAVWPEKPIVSYFWRVTREITGSYPSGKSNPVLTTTYFGEAYHQLGLFGVFFAMFFYLLTLLISIRIINKFQYTELIIFSIIIHLPMDVRGGFNSFFISQVSLIYPMFILMVLGVYKLKRIKCNSITNELL